MTGTPRRPNQETLNRAAQCLRDGGLVALPTETVYGLAADATNDQAVARIFAAKGRPAFNPLICHISDIAMARRLGVFDNTARRLAQTFWPGPLTLIVRRRGDCPVSPLASAGRDTLALRMPDHPTALALIARTQRPLAAPSANPSGGISPTRAAHVAEGLGDKVDMILDGGPCRIGVESTVVSVADNRLRLLRPGSITRAQLEAAAGIDVSIGPAASTTGGTAGAQIEAPGMLASHYAPKSPLRLNATAIAPGEALLAFGHTIPKTDGPTANLSPSGDLTEAAANLFALLRQLDTHAPACIAVMPIPQEGIGEAINDRLTRAAAPRPGAGP